LSFGSKSKFVKTSSSFSTSSRINIYQSLV